MKHILDLRLAYSPAEAYSLLENLGKYGRIIYLISEIIIDLPYAVIYSFVYALIIAALYKKNKFTFVKYLIFFPFLIGFFDILENTCIVLLISFFYMKITFIAQLASVFTSLKCSFAVVTAFVVLVGLVNNLMNRQNTLQ